MVYLEKTKKIEELISILDGLRSQGKTIVQCHGCYDLIHPGHISQFFEAKKLGDVLVVSITSDEFVKKGPHRPFFNEVARAEILSSLMPVDYVVIDKGESSEELLGKLKPDIYVKGSEYKGMVHPGLQREKIKVEENGGKLVFLDTVDDGLSGKYSSTNFIDQVLKDIKK